MRSSPEPRPHVLLVAWALVTLGSTAAQHVTFRVSPEPVQQLQNGGALFEPEVHNTRHECTGSGHLGLSCLFHDLVLWQKHFYYISSENVSIPEVREGWHMWWHPYGQAMLPEHVTVVSPSDLPWEAETQTEHLDEALIYNWLDQANMYHVLMETGNFIYATACKLLGACSHAHSHYQILSTGHFQFGEDNGLPAGHESLKCLSSKLPLWIGNPIFDGKVVVIGKTAVGIGVQCDDPKCEWDSIPYMQNDYTTGHRQLMLDCMGVEDSQPSQQETQVVIVQRLLSRGRSMLNVLEVHDAVAATGAKVCIFSTEGIKAVLASDKTHFTLVLADGLAMFCERKTLKEQAEAVAHAHIYILIHGAAMALTMFLPKHAAIVEIQHFYANSPAFPSNMYHRAAKKYDMVYHHQVMVSPRSQDLVLNHQSVLEDEVYKGLDPHQKMMLWEQGLCPGQEVCLIELARCTLHSRNNAYTEVT